MSSNTLRKITIVFAAIALMVLIPFKAFAVTSLSIVTQPADYSGQVGEKARFSVEAEGENLSYQWQYLKDDQWINLGGSTAVTAEYSITIKDNLNNRNYRCVITDANDQTVISDTAVLHVVVPPKELAIITQPSDYTGAVGEKARFSVVAEGDGLSYQWQYLKDNQWINLSGSTAVTAEYSITIKDNLDLRSYRCVVTDDYNEVAYSDVAVLYVERPHNELQIVTQPSNYSGPVGEKAHFSVVAEGDGLSYQWQYLKNDQWVNLSGSTAVTADYSITIKDNLNGRVYRCFITDSYGATVTSDEAILIVPKQNFTVTFHANGGFFGDDSDTYIDEYANKGNYYIDYGIEPHREGYYFVGWVYNNKPVNSMNRINITGNADVYADWAEAVTVTYYANGGQWQHGDDVDPVTTETRNELKGSTYYVGIEEPVRSGHKFAGWKVNGSWVDSIVLTSDITVEAQWTACAEVTFDGNGGGWYYWEPDEYEGHSGLDLTRVEQWEIMESWINMAWPEREGYEFVGWSTNPDAIIAEPEFFYDITEDVTFYAIWRQMGVIHYNANGGDFRYYDGPNTYTTVKEVDDYVSGPDFYYVEYFQRPERDGYEFNGWVDEQNNPITGEILVDNNTNLTVFATWIKRVTITYDAYGGSWDVEVHQDGQVWNEYREQDYDSCMEGEYYRFHDWRPQRDGYEWVGWMFEDETPVEDREYLLDDDITVFAMWIKLKKVNYQANGGYFTYVDPEHEEFEDNFNRYVRADEEYHLDGRRPEIDVDDMYFIGWTTEQDNYETLVDDILDLSDVDEITLYAFWYKPATITYHGNGGFWREWNDELEEDIEIDTLVRTANDNGNYRIDGWHPYNYSSNSAFRFIGYALEEDSNEVVYFVDEELEFVAEDMDLYAVWVAVPKIVFNAGEGCFSDGRTEQIRLGDNNQKVFIRCEAPQRLGYDFLGWVYADDPNNEIVDESILELHDGEVYEFIALWEKRNTIIVNYDPNGGSFGDPERLDYRGWDQDPDSNFTVGCVWPWRFGYEFVGWSLDPNDTDAYAEWTYDLEEDTVFYAIWKRNIIVTLDATGGNFEVWVDGQWEDDEWIDGHYDYVDYDYFSVKENSIIPVRQIEANVSRDGYSFDGWTDAEGNYVNIVEVGTEDITLYASWIKTYDVTFDLNGGMDNNGNTEPVVWKYNEGDFIEPEYLFEPYREGYIFDGWTLNGRHVDYLDVVSDLTFVAQWIPDERF